MRHSDRIGRQAPAYQPRENEPYMNRRQQAYFREKLLAWKQELQQKVALCRVQFKSDTVRPADWLDKANQDAEHLLAFSTQQRTLNLLRQIDAALLRLDRGEYGYCQETGDEIGIRRLLAYPIALLSLEAQQRLESMEERARSQQANGSHPGFHLAA